MDLHPKTQDAVHLRKLHPAFSMLSLVSNVLSLNITFKCAQEPTKTIYTSCKKKLHLFSQIHSIIWLQTKEHLFFYTSFCQITYPNKNTDHTVCLPYRFLTLTGTSDFRAPNSWGQAK